MIHSSCPPFGTLLFDFRFLSTPSSRHITPHPFCPPIAFSAYNQHTSSSALSHLHHVHRRITSATLHALSTHRGLHSTGDAPKLDCCGGRQRGSTPHEWHQGDRSTAISIGITQTRKISRTHSHKIHHTHSDTDTQTHSTQGPQTHRRLSCHRSFTSQAPPPHRTHPPHNPYQRGRA